LLELMPNPTISPEQVRKLKPPRKKTPEGEVKKQCIAYLESLGWECIRLHAGTARGRNGSFYNVGKKGRPDWVIFRPIRWEATWRGFWLELKKPGAEPEPHQLLEHARLRKSGYLVCVADSRESLEAWMKRHGLF
jgi:hypothetical protein